MGRQTKLLIQQSTIRLVPLTKLRRTMIINNFLKLYCSLDHFLFEKCYENLFRTWIELHNFTYPAIEDFTILLYRRGNQNG